MKMLSLSPNVGLQVNCLHLGECWCCARIAKRSLAEKLMQKIIVRVLINSSICEKHKWLNPFRFLPPMDLDIIFDQIEYVDIRRQITSLHPVIEAKRSYELLENDVVFSHYLLTNIPGKTHHFTNDILQFHVLDHHRVNVNIQFNIATFFCVYLFWNLFLNKRRNLLIFGRWVHLLFLKIFILHFFE